ncbi:nucleotidyltransferase family protein [Marinilabilia sp.]
MNSDQEIFEKLREIKPLLNRDFSVKQIGLFGSFSDGTFSEDSDVDILVELEKPIGWKFFSLEL